jgi:hypothetical protein
LHEGRQLAILVRPQQKMPVVWHHGTGTNAHGRLIKRFPQDLRERLIVGRFLEQVHSRHAAIQHVKIIAPRATRAVLGIPKE